ncbi:hypothetical protein [Winogradskyella algicola]|uniref:hypothetical protein n=1 Tax=Winogradskyella algicola TaxID=2575815 RepID=UPI00110882BC|nr:hypothetical protein [Winogradskyella algicola]
MGKRFESNIEKLKSIAPKIYSILNINYNLEDGFLHKEKKEINNKLIQKYIVNKKVFNHVWVQGFCKAVEEELKLPVVGATFGTTPNYGGYVQLGKKGNQVIELHFYVSLILNVFSIHIAYISEEPKIQVKNNSPKNYINRKIDVLVVSPTDGFFDEEFKFIENLINNKFNGVLFLPFALDAMDIDKLKVTMSGFNNFNCRLGGVFFSKFLPYNYMINEIPQIVGNENYKIDKLK